MTDKTMAESYSTGSHFYQTLTFGLWEVFGDTKEYSKSVYRRRTDHSMVKGTSTKGQTTIYKT
jgi:hypothetical protein